MKKKEFVKTIEKAMEIVENDGDSYTCNVLGKLNWNIKEDYEKTYGEKTSIKNDFHIPICFGEWANDDNRVNYLKQIRLNALAMYMAQSLAYGYYKNL